MTATQDDMIAELEQTIAELRHERDAALARETALAQELAARSAELAKGTAEMATRTSEFDERIEYRAATIDVLKVMSASPGDARPVFDLIVRHATELCNVPSASLFEYDGERVHIRSDYRSETILASSALAAYTQLFPMRPTRGSISCRAILDRQIIHIRDLRLDPELAGFARELGHRSQVSVPLIRDDHAIGVITIGALAPGGFSDSQIELLKTFAEQAVIAIGSAEMYRKLNQRTADLQESLEYQTATSDVLKIISRSAFDLQPVLATLLKTAARLCDAETAGMTSREGDSYRVVATFSNAPAFDTFIQGQSFTADRASVTGRTALEGHIIHIADLAADPEYAVTEAITLGGVRTLLGVPLLREGEVAGVIILGRLRVEPFTDRQIELVSTFADQAVIAIENTRLLTGQREALEHQTATAEVLQVINVSPGNLAPVFDTILEKAHDLCGAIKGALVIFDGEHFSVVAVRGLSEAYTQLLRQPSYQTWSDSPRTQLLSGADIVIMSDLAGHTNPTARAAFELEGVRTVLFVPLRREGTLLGYITAYRLDVRPFVERQISLLKNFAAQAVIAMENARLINEQREALEQQTATAEVLQVINASPGKLGPVFDAMLDKALRLCESSFGVLATYDGEFYHTVATRGVAPGFADLIRKPVRPTPGTALRRLLHGEGLVHIADYADEAYRSANPLRRALADESGARSAIWVALRRDDTVLGLINIYRQEVRPYSDKQIALLENFAAQAVIAMENARLIDEQREALEQQTATAEVLQVINSSPGNLAPVFDTMLERALHLCESAFGVLATYDGEAFHHVALRGVTPELAEFLRQPFRSGPGLALHRVLQGEDVVQVTDILNDDAYRSGIPGRRAMADLGGARTQLLVALRKDDVLLGVLLIFRQEVRPFTGKQIALLQTFAAQAVIAMENARLITEQREALEQQTATAEVLGVINASPGNLTPVFEVILEKAHDLCGAALGSLATYDGEHFRAVATRGLPSSYGALVRQPFKANAYLQKLVDGDQFVHIRDMKEDRIDSQNEIVRHFVEDTDFRTALVVPLRKDGALLGAITAYRLEVCPFSERDITVLESFAAQAVIAMENARLLDELRQRTGDLQESLEQQTATAEVLQVINASPGNLAPVFDAMLEKAMRLCEAQFGVLSTYDGERFRRAATRGMPVAETQGWPEGIVPDPGSALECVVNGDRVVHILDLVDTDAYRQGVASRLSLVETTGARTALWMALRREDALLGVFVIYRREVRAFSNKQIALVKNFAAQAVIAMENARLITEQREALEQQTATAEVLQVINASPGHLQPVFEAILDKAHALCGADVGSLASYDGERFSRLAAHGYPPEYEALIRPPNKPAPYTQKLLDGARFVHDADPAATASDPDDPFHRAAVEIVGTRTVLFVPLRKDGRLLGYINAHRREVRPFSEKEIALLENFAAQAVIAMENARLITEQREALEQQTATAEVLQVINASPGNLRPVFDAMLEKAMRLCEATFGLLLTYDGGYFHLVAQHGVPAAFLEFWERNAPLEQHGGGAARLLETKRPVQTLDVREGEGYRTGLPISRALVDLAGGRTLLGVPLLKDGAVVGSFLIYRREVRAFSDKQIALLESFAAQAVIAMENARLITETREALEQQTAMAEVLQVINSSPGDLAPVFDTILEKAMRLCGAALGSFNTYQDGRFVSVAQHGVPAHSDFRAKSPLAVPGGIAAQIVETKRPVQILDAMATENYRAGQPNFRAMVDLAGIRTSLAVPLLKDAALLGFITIHRQEVLAFSDRQAALLQNFAAQAVIAMENARLIDEIRQRQEELRVTFENMGDGVAMFDETPRLVAWNRKFQEIFDVPDALLAEQRTYADYIRYLTERGDYGTGTDVEEQVHRITENASQHRTYERTRPDGRVIEIRNNPVAGGGFVLIFSDITERKQNEAEIRAARDAAEEASRTIEAAYRDLKTAQANLIQAEKMASLGQLTAGIAHEIKNPLNFVNNFAALSVDLLSELKETAAPGFAALTDDQRAEIDDISAMLTSNLEKITEHGKRADGIVKAMLEHSRGSSGERRMVDLNALIDEALNLAYHGARAQDQSFNITLERDFGQNIAPIEVNPQDITRVFLNIFANGFYAVTTRARDGGDAGFEPTLKVITRDAGEAVEIRVRDNGTGIPADIRDKLFQPFFTTKPTGEGTGLGLSITYDIVTQQHGGSIAVDSTVDEYSEFTIRLPRNR